MPPTTATTCLPPVPEDRRRSWQSDQIEGFRALHEIGFGRHSESYWNEEHEKRLVSNFQVSLRELLALPYVPCKDSLGYRLVCPCPFCPPYCFPLDTRF